MSKVINKDGKWVVVDDQGGVQSTPFTERSAADSFMNLRDGILNPPAARPPRGAYGPPKPGDVERPEELARSRPEPSQSYGPAPNVQSYGPPAPIPPPAARPWRAADTGERDIYRVGRDMRTQREAGLVNQHRQELPGDEPPGWLSKVNMSQAQWRALLAGLGVQNMPSTPNPNHPEEY